VPSSLYNERRHQVIVQAVRNGNYRTTAAGLAGISYDTLKRWIYDGRNHPEQYPHYEKLVEDIEFAEAEVEAELVGVVRQHALSETPGSWTAAMTFLERRHPDRFGRRDTTVVEGGKEPIKSLQATVLVDESAREAGRALLRAVAGPGEALTERSGVRDEPAALPPGRDAAGESLDSR
jgi:hypothetical protein